MAERNAAAVKQEGGEVQNRKEHREISGKGPTVLELQPHNNLSKYSRSGLCTD